jgi:tetratricopeptide (TPR) repeat protein
LPARLQGRPVRWHQGAEEGDPRLKQALGLLHENKIGEAVPLLEAFAKDTEAKIEKDRKEAAVAYRNLGAIAGLADPKRALEAYEKALALDPDDIQSLYWSGVIQIGYGDLKTAQTRLERVQELAKTSDQAFYKYAALGTLGDIKQKRGDLGGALQSYQGTISIVSRLAKSDSGNALWQRDLSVSYIKVGDVLVQQGNLPEAPKSYQAGLAIRERLAKSDPGNAGWQYDLGISNERIGDVQITLGDLGAALKSYEAQHEIISGLAKDQVCAAPRAARTDLRPVRQGFISPALLLLEQRLDRVGEPEALPARDFVPWRFSDDCRRSAWMVS